MSIDLSNDPLAEDSHTNFSDDEFDSLLATITLPGFISPLDTPGTRQLKRKNQTNSLQQDDDPSHSVYEPIKFGEISKYMANKRKKLKLQERALRDRIPSGLNPPQIFSNMIIHINGYTNPPLSELRNLIILHGGTYMAYLDHKSVITHIIASTLTPKKHQEFRNYKVVKPEWIVKSISVGRLLNWSDFRLLAQHCTPMENQIAKGEFTGGKVITQKNLFHLSKAPLSTLSIQSSTQTPSPNQTPQQKDLISSLPPDTLSSSPQSTLNPSPMRCSNEASQKISNPDRMLNSSNTGCNHTHSPPLNLSAEMTNNHQPSPKQTPLAPTRSSSSENQEEIFSMSSISCTDPDFIQKYFQQSRLHHLSAWKADLLHRVSALAENKESKSKKFTFPKKKLKGNPSDGRVIMHIDFDCFFISAGLTRRPELRGKPLAVCHAKANGSGKLNTSTSEIASCSYEARAFGVRNGQTLGKAQQLCPEIQTIPYDFELYENLSLKFYNILLSYADELQAVSVDECLIDVSSRFTSQFSTSGFTSMMEPSVLKFAEEIRTVIRKETQCEASVGISCNVLLAKLATKKAKPCGSFFLAANRAYDHLNTLAIDQLPGFGWSQKNEIEQKLPSVRNVGDIRTVPLSRLIEVLGPTRGKTLHQYAHGIDDRSLKSKNQERKTVSAVINYGIRFQPAAEGGNNQVQNFLRRLGLEVSRRLTELYVSGNHLTLKIMKRAPNAPIEPSKYMGHGICEEFSKSTKLSGPAGVGVSDGIIIGQEAWKLLQSMAIQPEDLRGIGIQINQLEKHANRDTHKHKYQSTLSFQTTKVVESIARQPGSPQDKNNLQSASKPGTKNFTMRTPTASTSARTSIITLETPSSTPVFIPPASQLDLSVVNELPASLKMHILKSVYTAPEPIDKNDSFINITGNVASIDLVTPQKSFKSKNNEQHQDYQGLPSPAQVDWKLLAELPSSVRKPIEAVYKNSRKYHRYLPPITPPNFNPRAKRETRGGLDSLMNVQDRFLGLNINVSKQQSFRKKSSISHRVAPIGPSQKLINKKTFKLLTQNIQPKNKHLVQVKEGEEMIPEDHQETHELLPTPNKISDEQLEALEIDPKFFREISRNGNSSVTRAFQLDLIWNQFQSNRTRFKEVTNKTDRWKKWRKNFDRPNKKILEINLPEPPRLVSKHDERGLNKLEDILELIELWINSNSSDNNIIDNQDDFKIVSLIEIEEKDVSIIEQFLIDSIDSHSKGSVGQDLEKVTKIVQWWEHLILSIFLSSSNPNSNHASLAWKSYWENTIDRIKSKINLVAIRDFGAPIY